MGPVSRWVALGIALVVALAPALAPAQPRTVKVAMASKVVLDNLPVFVGMHAGFFDEAGLKIDPSYFPGGGAVVRAISTRSVELGHTVAASAVLIAAAQGEPLRIVAANTAPMVGILWVVPADSPIKTIQDLKGKKAGFSTPGSVSHVALQTILKAEALDKDVQLVRVGTPGDSWAALKNGIVDAAWHNAPAVYELLLKKEARILFDASKYIKVYQQTVVVAMEDMVRKEPELIRTFLKARARAVRFIWEEPEKTIAIWAQELGLTVDAVRLAYRDLPRTVFETGLPKSDNLQGTLKEVMETGAVKQPIDFAKLVDASLLPR
jgi:NitT/TauT family transport system substrate-binding protein